MIKKNICLLILLFSILGAQAFDISNPRMNEAADTITANRLLSLPEVQHSEFGANIATFARSFVGCGRDDYYNTDSVASLQLNLSTFTPITLINASLALAKARLASSAPGWRDYAIALENISCRRGEDKGFNSLMWHASDWIVDNIYRGNAKERTEHYQGVIERTKSLDYLTRHRNEYAVLTDSANYENTRMTEMGFRTHRIPTLKKETINRKEIQDDLRDGDILLLNPPEDSIDTYIIGIIVHGENGPTIVYLDPDSGKVVEWTEPLTRLFKLKTKRFNGYRIIRPQP